MICCPVLFILLRGRGTSCLARGISCLVGGIFICCPLTLYIPRTFHIPLSPNYSRISVVLFYVGVVLSHDYSRISVVLYYVGVVLCHDYSSKSVVLYYVGVILCHDYSSRSVVLQCVGSCMAPGWLNPKPWRSLKIDTGPPRKTQTPAIKQKLGPYTPEWYLMCHAGIYRNHLRRSKARDSSLAGFWQLIFFRRPCCDGWLRHTFQISKETEPSESCQGQGYTSVN